MWIRAIQDFDYCGNDAAEAPLSESQILAPGVQKNKDELKPEFSHLLHEITSANQNQKVCKSGWLFHMLDAVTELAPKFRAVYTMGATSLSVVLNDYEGASRLYTKGVKQFPGDWKLPYHAAYHFMFDKQDLARAADMLKLAAENGAPPWVHSLAARAYTATGQGELAIRTLLAFREYTSGDLRKEVDQRIERIRRVLVDSQANPSSNPWKAGP